MSEDEDILFIVHYLYQHLLIYIFFPFSLLKVRLLSVLLALDVCFAVCLSKHYIIGLLFEYVFKRILWDVNYSFLGNSPASEF